MVNTARQSPLGCENRQATARASREHGEDRPEALQRGRTLALRPLMTRHQILSVLSAIFTTILAPFVATNHATPTQCKQP